MNGVKMAMADTERRINAHIVALLDWIRSPECTRERRSELKERITKALNEAREEMTSMKQKNGKKEE